MTTRRLTVIMAADVVGYSGMIARRREKHVLRYREAKREPSHPNGKVPLYDRKRIILEV
ncbi:hypothetical protein SAMN05444161_9074 [Rhizobiales bacterium GAS191]|nr:hypothetical protein SAMN05444161_9074 [Rhizobiales bacterium GAS191]